MMSSNFNDFLKKVAGLLLLFLVIAGGTNLVMAQGVASINVTGIPSVINDPFTDQFEENFRNGRYQVIFTYNNANTQPVDFRFEFSLSKDGKEVFEITSEPKSFSPGAYVFTSVFDELPFRETFDDLLDQLTNEQRQQVIQGGSIPEGNYLLNIRPIAENTGQMISGMPSVNPFSVIYPQAPILVNPSDNSNLTLETPVFNWTPVPVGGYAIEYQFLLVEVLGNQTPLQAINSNRAHAEARVTGQNTLVYTPEFLPLEKGQEYAWRVTARSVNGDLPIRNEGESNIRTFTYKSGIGSETLADLRDLEELPLVPGFAQLANLDQMDVSEGGNYYELNGRATLLMNFVSEGQKNVRVEVNNLRIQKGSIEAPILMGGSLKGSGEDLTDILNTQSDLVSLNDVTWRFGEGISSGVVLRSPDGQSFDAQGRLILESQGARGTVSASGSPLFYYGDDLVEAEVTSINASFPEGTVYGEGSVKILEEETGCDATRFAFIDGNLVTTFRCTSPIAIPLVESSTRLNMLVERMMGDLSIDTNSGEMEYDLELMTSIGLETEEGPACEADAVVSISSENGLEVSNFTQDQSCRFENPRIDLGFFTLELHQSELQELAFDAQSGDWDFEILLGAKFEIPSFGDWGSYDVRDILIDEEGAHFNSIDFSEELAGLPDFNLNNYSIQLETLQLAEFLFPIFNWDQTGPGPWDLSFSGKVGVPNTATYPACIRGQQLSLRGGNVSGDEVSAAIVPENFNGCSFEFGAGYAFNIDDLAGQFGVRFTESGEKPIGRLDFGGSLTLGQPFTCDANSETELGNTQLSLTTGLVGEINNIIPSCDVHVGPFTANVTSSQLTFEHTPETGQIASLNASADLDLNSGQTASGTFDLNLITGRFNSLNFLIDEPFDWNIPSDDPVLSFRLNQARLTEEGFSVDGRQQFNLDADQVMGTTFDSLLIDIETLQIKRGRILFDSEFGFAAGIDPNDQSLTYQAVPLDAELLQDPGLYLGMSGQLQIDSQGIHADGQADASLKFNGEQYDLAQVDYSDGFRFRLFPFEVGNGQADIMYNDSRVAWLDEDGFHPSPGYFADLLIPEHLPLPRMDIAYLTLKEEGELLVEVTENQEGNYSMSTLPGKSLTLTAPFFDPQGTPSLTNVTLNNVVISGDPSNPEILEGSIEVSIPQNDPMWQLKDRQVPITLRKLHFGSRPVNGSPLTALHLLGDLHLFENDIPDAQQEFGFFIQSDGVVQANLNVTGMDAQVPLLPEDKALLKVDGINGTFTLAEGATSPNYDLTIDSGFELNTITGISTGAEFDLRLTPGSLDLQNLVTEDLDVLPEFDFGVFGLKLNAIESIPEFNYTSENGFDFAFALDADIRIQPEGSEEIVFPLQGFEIRDTGIQIPIQDISSASIPGLTLPEFEIAGFTFKPLSLQTNSPFTFNWGDGIEFNPDVNMSFEVDLPEFEGTGLNPPDGLTFNNVGLVNGFLSGSVQPFQPLGGAEVDLVPGMPDTPTLLINELFGSLEVGQDENGDFFQAVNIDLTGEIGNLPAFNVDDPNACVQNGSFSLSLVRSKYFEGTVSGIQPCGYLELGPAKISVTNADLNFSVSADQQLAELDGGVMVSLPAKDQGSDVIANGNLVLDIIEGDIKDGAVSINQQFGLEIPHGSNDPLFTFGINQAVLNTDGLLINGGGDISADGVQSTVQFTDLLIGFNPFGVQSGNASIATNFAMEVGVQPLALKLKDPATALPADNAIELGLSGGMILDNNGLNLTGSSTATIRFQGEEYAALEVAYEDGFALNTGGFAVNQGRALFYEMENGIRSQDPLAVLSSTGFDLGGFITSLIPSRIPLPSEDIAYIDIKDSNDSLLVDVTSDEQTGGYTISTDGSKLPLVVAALEDQNGNPTQIDVGFSLTTDGAYNVTGGSLSMESDYSLEPALDLPVSITEFSLGDEGNALELKAGLKVELPGPLKEHNAIAHAVISQNGLSQANISVGTHLTAYQQGITPLFAYEHSGNVQGSQETDIFEAELWGIEAELGATNSMSVSGILNSSLITDVSGGNDPIFYSASWSDTGWDFNIDPGSLGNLSMGDATLALNQQDGIDVISSDNSFYLVLNGQVSMDDVIGEPLDISVQDLEVGVDDLDTSPVLHFAIGGASGALGDQTFSLFEGAFEGLIESPTITLNGRSLALSSESGILTFLEKNIDYNDLLIDTQGGVTFSSIEAQNIELIPDYVSINTLTLTGDDGLRLDSELAITLPAPVDQTSSSVISIYRDDQNVVQIEATAPAFDLDQQYALGDFGHFKLNEIQADINPYDWESSGIYANGDLYKSGESSPIISFGETGQITQNPGIGLSAESPYVQFNATGNVGFDYDFSVFRVSVNFDEIATTTDGFEIELSGSLGMNMSAMSVSSTIRYENFIIDQDGVKDTGNIDGTGTLEMDGIGSIEIGQFIYETYENGTDIEITDASEKKPGELDGDQEDIATRTESGVTELLCFGPCPVNTTSNNVSQSALTVTIDAGSDGGSGGISGGVETIFFMKKQSGEFELMINGLNASMMDNFSIFASMHYMRSDDGFLLRAAASGDFTFGNQSVSAAVAGKFANIGGETSYGLFVAAQTSVGIPIVPGVIELTGAGGGFFWKPTQEDIDLVIEAVETGLKHEIVQKDKFEYKEDLLFAAQLFGSFGIAGSGGQYVIEGSTFIQFTDKGFYMDADGVILGMDGTSGAPANTLLDGGMSLNVQWDPSMFINGTFYANAEVPAILTGDGQIEYFAAENNGKTVWGIMGQANFSIYSGIMTGGGELLASGSGVLLEVNVGFDVDIPILKVNSNLTGSIWMIDDPDFSMPFGAYVVFNAEACLGICITADAKAAFVTKRSGGFQLYGAVRGCVDLLIDEACLSAWVSLTESKMDGGFGKGDHNDLVAQAQEQRDQFRASIEAMKNSIAAAKDKLSEPPVFSGPAYSDEDVYKAGANIYSQGYLVRRDLATIIENEVEHNEYYSQGGSLPTSLQNILTDLMVRPKAYKLYDLFTSRSNARQELQLAVSQAETISDAVTDKLNNSVEKAIEFSNDAETAFEDMLTSMNQSPVSNIVKPASRQNVTDSVSFTIDETMAENQATNTQSLAEEVEQLDQQFRESIAQVEENLDDMQTLLAAEYSFNYRPPSEGTSLSNLNPQFSNGSGSSGPALNVTPSINALAKAYTDVYEKFERYFALEANINWMEWEWAYNLREEFINSSSIQTGIGTLSSRFNSRLNGRNSGTTGLNAYRNEAHKVAQRNQAILRFSNSNFDSNFPHPSSSSAPTAVNDLYSKLSTPNCEGSGLDCVRDSVSDMNQDFWYNMHVLGLAEHGDKSAQVVTDDVVPEMETVKNSLREGHQGMTSLLDTFYSNKAELTAILYNMIDNYVNWKEGINFASDGETLTTSADTSNTDYRSRLLELSNDLRPPQIADIQAVPSRHSASGNTINFNTFFNDTEISWTATHPVGVIENSINIELSDLEDMQDINNTSVAFGNDDYLSLGDETSLNIYPFKTALGTGSSVSETKMINMGLRVRGNAGNTATRRSLFWVEVGPEGLNFSDSGMFGTNGDPSVLNEDVTKPEKPVIKLGDVYAKTSTYVSTGKGYSGTYDVVYWTNDPSNITLKIQAYDPESDISSYEYAIGTSKGATDVVDWTTLQGVREFVSEVPTSQITGESQLINMSEGVSYYISARATNGEGMVSDVAENQYPLKLDTNKPSKPGTAYVTAPLMMSMNMFGYSTPVDPAVATAPDLNISTSDINDWEDAVDPEISATWTESSDSDSGIDTYQYIVTTSENVAQDQFTDQLSNTTSSLEMTYTGGDEDSILQDFDTEVYVHVRAIDNAGNASDIYTIGPRVPRDPTSPQSGRLQAKVNPDDVKLYFTELPYDPESDLKGIQYSIGTSPGSDDLRAWPGNGQVDFGWNHNYNYYLSNTNTQSSGDEQQSTGGLTDGYSVTGNNFQSINYSTNTSNMVANLDINRYLTLTRSDIPEGVDMYINYRVVNGQDKISSTRSTGPISLDESIPEMPSLDVTYKIDADRLHIELEDITDPETGITSVRFAVFKSKSVLPLKSWSDLGTIYGIDHSTFDMDKYVYFSGGQVSDFTDLVVKIKITNGAGLERMITRSLTFSDSESVKNVKPPTYSYPKFGF